MPQADIHAERIQLAIDSGSSARSALVASWQRSVNLYGLDPSTISSVQMLTECAYREVSDRMEPLLHVARSSMDRLYQAVGGIGCCVLLADNAGIPVERRGAIADDETFQQWGLWPGAVWSEETEGTNGIGTCIAEQRALTIHRDQHFHSRNIGLSCTVAPIYDHEGKLMAALDVSSCRADLTEAFVDLIGIAVNDAARRIEADHFRQVYHAARIQLVALTTRNGSGMIAVDKDDLIIGANRAARLEFDLSDEALRNGVPASDLLDNEKDPRTQIIQAERSGILRALAHSQGNVSVAAKLLGISRATLHRKLNRLGISRPN